MYKSYVIHADVVHVKKDVHAFVHAHVFALHVCLARMNLMIFQAIKIRHVLLLKLSYMLTNSLKSCHGFLLMHCGSYGDS